MRKSGIRGIILVSLGVAFLAFLGSAYGANDVAVSDLQGDVKAMSPGAKEWKSVAFGTMLSSGDTLKTGQDSYVDLSFRGAGQDAVVRMNSDTTMKIESYVATSDINNKKIALDLAMGDILVKANKLKNESQFQVKTPTSVVGVRGTGFKVQVTAEK